MCTVTVLTASGRHCPAPASTADGTCVPSAVSSHNAMDGMVPARSVLGVVVSQTTIARSQWHTNNLIVEAAMNHYAGGAGILVVVVLP